MVRRCKTPLEMEIEKVRMDLHKDRNFEQIKTLDAKTYALSLKMDRLIVKYMKSK